MATLFVAIALRVMSERKHSAISQIGFKKSPCNAPVTSVRLVRSGP